MRTLILAAAALVFAPPEALAPDGPAPASAACAAAEAAGREAIKVFRNARLAPRPVVTQHPALASDWEGKTPPFALIERTRAGFRSNVLTCANVAGLAGASDGAPQGDAEVEASLPVLSADGQGAISLVRLRTPLTVVSAFIYLEKRDGAWRRVGSRLASIS